MNKDYLRNAVVFLAILSLMCLQGCAGLNWKITVKYCDEEMRSGEACAEIELSGTLLTPPPSPPSGGGGDDDDDDDDDSSNTTQSEVPSIDGLVYEYSVNHLTRTVNIEMEGDMALLPMVLATIESYFD